MLFETFCLVVGQIDERAKPRDRLLVFLVVLHKIRRRRLTGGADDLWIAIGQPVRLIAGRQQIRHLVKDQREGLVSRCVDVEIKRLVEDRHKPRHAGAKRAALQLQQSLLGDKPIVIGDESGGSGGIIERDRLEELPGRGTRKRDRIGAAGQRQ